RRVERAGTEDVKQLERKIRVVALPVKDAVRPEILRADVRAEVRPLWVARIGCRIHRIWSDVAEAARHPDAIRPYEVLAAVVVEIVFGAVGTSQRGVLRRALVILRRVPPLRRFVVERRIREQPQPDDSGRLAVV